MMRRFLILGLVLAATTYGQAAENRKKTPSRSTQAAQVRPVPVAPGEVQTLQKADVLPLALDDQFAFRKNQLFLHDSTINNDAGDKMIDFERLRYDYGAVSNEERRQRRGNYFTFWWHAARPANLKVRLEYRQANLGAYVQAKEVEVIARRGSNKTKFEIIGDEYLDDGRVLAWRAVLIEDGKIVALTQSFLWH